MKKRAAILLILYAIMMLSYGSLEMTHDFLHYLAAHHHSQLHQHAHGNHHHFHDHQHSVEVHSHDTESDATEFPSLIHFFLYAQGKPGFFFSSDFTGEMSCCSSQLFQSAERHPITPPPEKA